MRIEFFFIDTKFTLPYGEPLVLIVTCYTLMECHLSEEHIVTVR